MDFTLSNEQRAWQMTARKFAEEEIRPISLERDDIADPRETFETSHRQLLEEPARRDAGASMRHAAAPTDGTARASPFRRRDNSRSSWKRPAEE